MKNLKVLMVAYACEPNKGSESEVGWGWVKMALLSGVKVWVVTRINNKESIELGLYKLPNNHNVTFIYVDLPKWFRFWKRKNKGARIYSIIWQFYATIKVSSIVKDNKINLIHHVTFVSDYIPTLFIFLKFFYKLKLIWGPVGSHPDIPINIIIDRKNKYNETKRKLLKSLLYHNPLIYFVKKSSDKILAIDSFTISRLKVFDKKRVKIIPAIGIDKEIIKKNFGFKKGRTVTILYVGRFIYWKGPYLALLAFNDYVKRYDFENARLLMVGKGPMESYLKKLVKNLDLQENVSFIKWMHRNELFHVYDDSDIFLFPSFEGGGLVVLEAMARGLPIVCLNYGGPGFFVDESSGIKVNLNSLESTTLKLSEALYTLSINDKLRESLSIGAINRAKEFTWEKKSLRLKEIYLTLKERI